MTQNKRLITSCGIFDDFSNCMQEQINRRRIVIEIEAFIVSYKRVGGKEKNSFGKDFL